MPFLEIIVNVLFFGILLAYWILAFVTLYHLTRFGIGVQPKRFAGIFLLGSVALSGIAITLFTKIEITHLLT